MRALHMPLSTQAFHCWLEASTIDPCSLIHLVTSKPKYAVPLYIVSYLQYTCIAEDFFSIYSDGGSDEFVLTKDKQS